MHGKMNDKIKAHLEAVCKNNDWETSDAGLMETLKEAKEVYREPGDSHRHYDELLRVVDVDGMIIGFQDFYMTGDMCMSDTDLEYDLSEIREYEPKEITKTIYVPRGGLSK